MNQSEYQYGDEVGVGSPLSDERQSGVEGGGMIRHQQAMYADEYGMSPADMHTVSSDDMNHNASSMSSANETPNLLSSHYPTMYEQMSQQMDVMRIYDEPQMGQMQVMEEELFECASQPSAPMQMVPAVSAPLITLPAATKEQIIDQQTPHLITVTSGDIMPIDEPHTPNATPQHQIQQQQSITGDSNIQTYENVTNIQPSESVTSSVANANNELLNKEIPQQLKYKAEMHKAQINETNIMEKTLIFVKNRTEYKMNKSVNEMESTRPTTQNINKYNNRKICQNNTDSLNEKTWKVSAFRTPYRNKRNRFPATSSTIDNITTNSHPHNNSSNICSVNHIRHQRTFGLNQQHLLLMLWLLLTLMHNVESLEMTTRPYTAETSSSTMRFSQLLSTNGQISLNDNEKSFDEDDTFRPFVPKDLELISRNVFTPSGQFRVFQPIDTDLRAVVTTQSKSQHYGRNKKSEPINTTSSLAASAKQTSSVYGTQQMTGNHKNTKANVRAHVDGVVYQKDSSNLSLKKQPELHTTDRKTNEFKHEQQHYKQPMTSTGDVQQNGISKQNDLTSDLKSLEDLLVEYVTNFFEKGQYVPMPGLLVELQNNHSQPLANEPMAGKTRHVRQTFATNANVRIDLPRTMATGRLLFLTGLKKVLWPVFMGLQVLKSLLIAMFIPAIIGSFTKLLGKGISTGSAPLFIRPMEPPQELDFRDNSINFDDDNKFLVTDEGMKNNMPYAYNQPDATQIHNEYVFDPSSANNQLSYTRLGMNERQHQLMQDSYMSALQSIGSASFKNSGSLSSGSSGLVAPMAKRPPPVANVNTFQQFQNVPDSSLLLSNYDPFYSPLLSRLDSVFAQLKINSDKEMCREKLICLMYANPAKYAPYSNLVSAQLSRELNELRKPTSDNPDILRFFKYMRAAKDGQDGVDCEKTFDKCTEFKDFENPAMVSTYHDINKLVQARKLTSK